MGWEAEGLQVFPRDPTSMSQSMAEAMLITIGVDRSQRKVQTMLMLEVAGKKLAVSDEQIQFHCFASCLCCVLC